MGQSFKTFGDLIPVRVGARQDYYLDFDNGWGIYIWPDVMVRGEQHYGFWFRINGEDDKSVKRYDHLPLTRTIDGINDLMREMQLFPKVELPLS